MTDTEAKDFDPSSLHSDNLPALLQGLNISLALTSYQANRIMLVRSESAAIDVLFQEIPRPMGMSVTQDRLVLGSWAQVLDYRRQDELGAEIDPLVDACFVPRGSLVTGTINAHDIAWGTEGLWLVNSTFSCLATLSPDYNFVPRWIDGWLYYCESGFGRVWRCREDGSERTLVAELPGYTRGLDHLGSLLFVGLSLPRFSEGAPRLPLLERIDTATCGFWVIDLERLREVAWLLFSGNVTQIYDLVILHDMKFPHIVEWDNEKLEHCYRYPPLV